MKKVVIGSDHAGYLLKEKIKKALKKEYEFIDVGTHSEEPVDYPVYAEKAAEEVAANPDHQGILICGSGIGVTMAANKVPGIRAALAYSKKAAELARQHNDANILATAGREGTIDDPLEIVRTFLTTGFSGDERHQRRVRQIMDIEKHYCS